MENNYMCVNVQSSPVRSGCERTGDATVDSILARWNITYKDDRERRRVIELARNVASVMYLPPEETARVNGHDMPAEWVAHILGEATGLHVRYVLERYARLTYEVRHTTTYLRSALYNSVMELELATDNEVAAEFGGAP